MMKKRILVIGGGPGGYVTAIKAAQSGAEVHIVEREKLGGTCLNVGCIPTKTLLRSAFFYKACVQGEVAGVSIEKVALDWSAVQLHKAAIVERLVSGVAGLLSANKVTVHTGNAVFTAPGVVSVDGKPLPKADAIIIASGSVPVRLDFPGAGLPQVLDSTQALALEQLPASVVIVGGGVIGAEFASIFSAASVKVTILEQLPEILPPVDAELAKLFHDSLKREGVEVLTGASLSQVKAGKGKNVLLCVNTQAGMKELQAETVLVAVGRRPNTAELGLELAGIHTKRGVIVVNDNFETNVPGVFAIGDCNAKNMLAHAASAQGEAVIDYLTSGEHSYKPENIPACVYTKPEIASVGLTEAAARAAGFEIAVGTFDLSGNGKTMIDGGFGLVKIIADKKIGEVLGVHILGPHATEMIAEAAAVMEMEGLAEDLKRTIHPHPTVSEAVGEAAMASFGNAIHWSPKRR